MVAIKTYNKLKLAEKDKRDAVLREIRILSKMSHPNVCGLIDKFESTRNLHIVLEHCGEINLRKKIDGRPKISLGEIKKLFKQIVEAIIYVHSLNITHNDIKMENVVLDRHNNVKLVDFGFARENATRQTSMICGTPNYMSPELLARERHFCKPVDVWALGVLLFYMITRQFPYTARNEIELTNLVKRHLPDLTGVNDADARDLLLRIFRKSPLDRISCEEMLKMPFLASSSFC